MSNEVINPFQEFKDNSGVPLANGTISFLVNTTTALGTIFSDEALTVAQSNPYTLDAYGRIAGDVKYTGLRTLLIKTESGATVRTLDNISTVDDSAANDLELTEKLNPATIAVMIADARLSTVDVGKSAPKTKEFSTGDGGGGTHDIVLSTSVTENFFDIWESTANPSISFVLRKERIMNTSQFGVNSGATSTVNRNAYQRALDVMVAGDTLTHTAVATIENATGSGATIVLQRADAVLNSTLFALNSSTDGITIIINGEITATSALDDVLRLTGADCLIKGAGSIQGNEVVLDTNSGDPLLQWRPSLIKVEGAGTKVKDVTCIHPSTVGLYLAGSDLKAENVTVKGGSTTHGAGTILFGIESGVSAPTADIRVSVNNCTVIPFEGKAVYSGIFGTSAHGDWSGNNFHGLLEHGLYNNGVFQTLTNNNCKDITTAAAIQSFSTDTTISNNTILDCAFGGIALQGASRSIIDSNTMSNIGLSGISLRKKSADASTVTYTNVTISNNTIGHTGVQSAIDVAMEANITDLFIHDNNITATADSSTFGSVRMQVLAAASVGGENLQYHRNHVNGSQIYGLYLSRFINSKVSQSTFRNTNQSGANDMSARFFECTNIEFNRNTVFGDANNSRILFAATADTNVQILATDNNMISPNVSTGTLCTVPTGEQALRNGQDSFGTMQVFEAANAVTEVFNTGAALSSRSAVSRISVVPLSAVAEAAQRGANYLEVKSIGNATFTLGTNSGAALGVAGAFYKYEVVS